MAKQFRSNRNTLKRQTTPLFQVNLIKLRSKMLCKIKCHNAQIIKCNFYLKIMNIYKNKQAVFNNYIL